MELRWIKKTSYRKGMWEQDPHFFWELGRGQKDFIEEVTFEVNALLFVIFHIFVWNFT